MALYGALAEAVRNGWSVDFGSVALDGTNPTSVVTTLGHIKGAIAVLNVKVAPGVSTSVVTYLVEAATPNQLDLYGWKPTTNLDTTLIASAGTDSVSWLAWGTMD